MTGQEEIIIPKEYHENWYKLIKEVPQGFANYDYNAVHDFFDNLRGCEICGLVAIGDDGECMACGNKIWNTELAKEYDSKEDYIKEMQFDEFEPVGEDSKVDINNHPKFGFESFAGWIPVVKKEDFKK